MDQPIIEVKERKLILGLGLIYAIIFAVIQVFCITTAEGEVSAILFCGLTFGVFTVLGIYMLLTYVNHRLKVFAGGQIEYSGTLGKKETFYFRDIAKMEQSYRKNTLCIILKDANGKRLARVEDNMVGYEAFAQWLSDQQKATEEAQVAMDRFGIAGAQAAVVSPVKVQGTGKGVRIFIGIMGVFMLVCAVATLYTGISKMVQKPVEEEAQWFHTFEDYDGKQMVEFDMISYQFASFRYSDAQGFYFVFDSDMNAYIVCMDNERLEKEFQEIYEYTFNDSLQAPKVGMVEGYAMPIEEDLKTLAIEELNILFQEDILTEENFESIIGSFYLDTTYQPEAEGDSPLTSVLVGIFLLCLGVYMIYYAAKGYQKVVNTRQKENVFTEKEEETVTVQNTVDLPMPRNLLITLLVVLIGASLGGVLWIFFYKLGRIAAVSGCVAVMGAVWGWSKFGRREMNAGAWVLCVLAGAGMIFLGNYISYAWEILESINASSPGRAQFWRVLTNMPSLMTELDLWSSFAADLGMGVLVAAGTAISQHWGEKKKK